MYLYCLCFIWFKKYILPVYIKTHHCCFSFEIDYFSVDFNFDIFVENKSLDTLILTVIETRSASCSTTAIVLYEIKKDGLHVVFVCNPIDFFSISMCLLQVSYDSYFNMNESRNKQSISVFSQVRNKSLST